jgi:hypothetical protein
MRKIGVGEVEYHASREDESLKFEVQMSALKGVLEA